MKNVITIGAAAAIVMLAAAFTPSTTQNTAFSPAVKETSLLKTTEKNVSLSESTLKWTGKKVTGQHYGTLKISDGKLLFDKNTLTGGEFTIDMNTMTVDDLTDAKSNGMLLGHLKSDDFFSVDKYSSASFKITKAEQKDKKDKSAYEITGDLTIKGITNSISFPAKIYVKKDETVAYANIKVDRTLYGIKYSSGQYFEGLGDKMIDDLFELDVRMVAK